MTGVSGQWSAERESCCYGPSGILAGVQISQNCAFYSLKGYVTESNPFIVNSTDIYLAAGGDILDACGHPFNVTVTQVQQTHRYFCYLFVDAGFFVTCPCFSCLLCFHSFIRYPVGTCAYSHEYFPDCCVSRYLMCVANSMYVRPSHLF